MDGLTNNEGASTEGSVKRESRLFAEYARKFRLNLETADINNTAHLEGGEQVSSMDIARQNEGLLKEVLSGVSPEDQDEFLAELSSEDRELAEKYLNELG